MGWVWLGLAGAALALGLAYASIGFSSLVILAAEAAAVALITVVAIAVLAAGGYHHHGVSAAPFSSHGASLPVLALGVTAAFGQFSGFESAATLGEEARRSTRTIPAAPFGWVVLAAGVSVAAGAIILLTPGLLPRMRRSPLLAVTAAATQHPRTGR